MVWLSWCDVIDWGGRLSILSICLVACWFTVQPILKRQVFVTANTHNAHSCDLRVTKTKCVSVTKTLKHLLKSFRFRQINFPGKFVLNNASCKDSIRANFRFHVNYLTMVRLKNIQHTRKQKLKKIT